MDKTPIVVFAYNRPDHLQITLDALARCRRFDECQVFIYCDGIKKPEQQETVSRTQEIARSWGALHHAEVIAREKNQGLNVSIIYGVTRACNDFGRVIAIEDDVVVGPGFINFMLEALDHYESDEQVYGIAGFLFTAERLSEEDAFFLPVTNSWGWATWKRAWDGCDFEAKSAFDSLKNKTFKKRFDLNGAYPWSRILAMEVNQSIDSWDICWYYHVFMHNGLVVYPAQTMVYNTGLDSSGIHCGGQNINPIKMAEIPDFGATASLCFPSEMRIRDDYLQKHRRSIIKAYSEQRRALFPARMKSISKNILIRMGLYNVIKSIRDYKSLIKHEAN